MARAIRGPIGIVADDLTGANDTAAQFSRRGGSALVVLSLERGPGGVPEQCHAVAVNSGSRNIAPALAAPRMARAIARLESYGVPFLYQKVDSTLRGNWALELKEALARRKGPVFLAPAFPLNGRTVEGGSLLVRGTPLHLSEAARDGLSPVRGSRIVDLLGEPLGPAARHIGLETLAQGPEAVRALARQAASGGARVLICDAREQRDLAVLAEAVLPLLPEALLAGSAGLARELAELLEPASLPGATVPTERAGPVLVIAGSRSQVTTGQVACLNERLRPVCVEVDPASVDGPWDPARCAALAVTLLGNLRRDAPGRHLLVTIGDAAGIGAAQFHQRSERLNALLGALTLRALNGEPLAGLVLTGGDVAASVLESLQVLGLRLGPEILPGIPLGAILGGAHEGLGVVTKAGAFGPPEALVEAVAALASGANVHSVEIRCS